MSLAADYARCAHIATRHYENFTVASRLVPRRLRSHIYAIYAFCRGVDDLGDEFAGDRLAALAAWEEELRRCYSATPERPQFRALQASIRLLDLPLQPFLDLIAANRRDQLQCRYDSFAELLDYCDCSASPVGRLVLAVWGYRDEERQCLSDATCTALQLTNFWQDIGRDLNQGRIYLPREDLERFQLGETDLQRLRRGPAGTWAGRGSAAVRLRRLVAFETARTRALFALGARLESRVTRRLALQLRLYRLGGEAVLSMLERAGHDPMTQRPAVGPGRKAAIAVCSLLPSRDSRRANAPREVEVVAHDDRTRL